MKVIVCLLIILLSCTAAAGPGNKTGIVNATDSLNTTTANATASANTTAANKTEATTTQQWYGNGYDPGYGAGYNPGYGRPYDGGGHGSWGNGWTGDNWDRTANLPACPPGQGRPSPSEACQLCPYGRYSPPTGGLRGPCLKCPEGTVTIKPGATECGCKPGTGTLTISEGPCKPCPNGTYSPGGSVSPCIMCPGSGFMVTPPNATRVSQCTCKPGFGSTVNFPLSCQECPVGTYANALAEIIDVPGVPPQGGKGITRGIAGATIRPCKPCCPAGVGTCGLSTLKPGATSYNACVLVEPTIQPYCCGTDLCRVPVPQPPTTLPAAAAAVAQATAGRVNFEYTYQGATTTILIPDTGLRLEDGTPIGRDPQWDLQAPKGKITLPPAKGGSSSGSSGWDSGGGSSSGWDSGGGSSSGWGSSGGSSSGWSSSSGSSSGWGSSSGGSSWGGSSSGWDAAISGGVTSPEQLLVLPGPGDSSTGVAAADKRSSDGSSNSTSAVRLQGWWGEGPPPVESLTVCDAYPRIGLTEIVGLAYNTPLLLSTWADKTPGTTCAYTPSTPLQTVCTSQQLAPYLVLTAAHCVDPTVKQLDTGSYPGCAGLQLINAQLCYGFTRTPGAPYNCNNWIGSIGVNYNPHPNVNSPYDQAIVFLGTPQPGPYYQYNYIENFPSAFNTTSNTFQALSYSADGNADINVCGCAVCDNMPCGLGLSGPSRGPLAEDPRAVGAVNPGLEKCGGGSGNCLSVNGQSCCIGTDSYEYRASQGACFSNCQNYWSTISRQAPLSRLWTNITVPLPQ